MTLLLGIDNGGTRVKLMLAREAGGEWERVRQHSAPTPRGDDFLEELARIVSQFTGDERVDAFAITVAGIVDDTTGVVLTSTNMRWLEGKAPARELASLLGYPGEAVQDGVATAEAEAILGAGRGWDDVFMLALGTRIAGAHVVGGLVRKGAHGAAGEVGHIASDSGTVCTCGQTGCLESLLGGTRLEQRWDATRGVESNSTARDVVDAADRSNVAAVRVLDEATAALAGGILGVVALIDPAIIVIGGGLSQSARWIVDPAVEKAKQRATFHTLPPIVRAELGPWAGAWGAVLAASSVDVNHPLMIKEEVN